MDLQILERPTTVQIVESPETVVSITEVVQRVIEEPGQDVVILPERVEYNITVTEQSIAVVEVGKTEIVAVHEGVLIRQEVQLSSSIIHYPSGEVLGGHRAIIIGDDGKAYYADRTVSQHVNKVLGVTTGASDMGADASIQTFGVLTEPSWSWNPGKPIYLGANGLLTQVAPSSGFLLVLGFSITATSIFINIKLPISLL